MNRAPSQPKVNTKKAFSATNTGNDFTSLFGGIHLDNAIFRTVLLIFEVHYIYMHIYMDNCCETNHIFSKLKLSERNIINILKSLKAASCISELLFLDMEIFLLNQGAVRSVRKAFYLTWLAIYV